MTNREPAPAVYLAAVLATEKADGGGAPCGFPSYRAARDAETLVRLGKRAAKIAVDRCNGILRWDSAIGRKVATWTEDDEARAEKAVAKIEKEASEILSAYGAGSVKAHGDPRGFVLSFRLASGRSNGMDQSRWGV